MDNGAPGLGEILSHSALDVPWLLAFVGAGALYAAGLRRRGGAPPWRRRAMLFYTGLVIVAVATQGPLEHYGNQLLWANFAGFLLITMVAPPILLAGAPLTLAFASTGREGRRRLRAFYRRGPLTWLTFPIVSWLLFAVVTYAWQFSSLTGDAAANVFVRDIQQVTLLAVGLLFWYPALAFDPVRWRMAYPLRGLYVMVEMVHKALFGGMFLAMSTPFHSDFAANAPAWAPSAIMDQRIGILILWIGGNMIFILALVSIAWRWVQYEARNSARIDKRLARERAAVRERRAALDKVFEKQI
jgi:putative copper resistance protein D